MKLTIIPLICCLVGLALSARVKVYNGDALSSTEQFPWVVFLVRFGQNGATCSGSLVQPNMVLTAGHCMWGGQSEVMSHVNLGVANGLDQRSGQLIEVAKWAVSPYYYDYCMKNNGGQSTVHEHDLAMVALRKSAQLNAKVHMVKLDGKKFIQMGEEMVLTGYGLDPREPDPKKQSGILKRGNMKAVKCVNENTYESNPICVDGTPAARAQYSQPGDSGGPLVRRSDRVQVGVVSGLKSYTINGVDVDECFNSAVAAPKNKQFITDFISK